MNAILRLIRNLVHRGALSRTRFANGVQVLQFTGTGGAPFDAIEHIEPYGYASRPLKGAEVIALSLGGNGSHTIAVLVGDRRYRLELAEGDAALYDYRGNQVWLKADLLTVKHTTKVRVEAPDIDLVGNVHVTGNVDVNGNTHFTGSVKANDKVIDDSHRHTGDSGGTINGVL